MSTQTRTMSYRYSVPVERALVLTSEASVQELP